MSEQVAGTQVLIVDDDPVMGELLDALLTVEGYRVTRAHSGEEALKVAREGVPRRPFPRIAAKARCPHRR
jgi:CheY-like chemotaxis protein